MSQNPGQPDPQQSPTYQSSAPEHSDAPTNDQTVPQQGPGFQQGSDTFGQQSSSFDQAPPSVQPSADPYSQQSPTYQSDPYSQQSPTYQQSAPTSQPSAGAYAPSNGQGQDPYGQQAYGQQPVDPYGYGGGAAQQGYQQPYGAAGGYGYGPPEHPQASTVQVLGIIGIFVGICAAIAWFMGAQAKKEIEAGAPYPWDGKLKLGYTLGKVFTIIYIVLFVLYIVFFVVLFGGLVAFR